MSIYKVTVQFNIDDENGDIQEDIASKGIKAVEEELAFGFSDPEYYDVTCSVRELK